MSEDARFVIDPTPIGSGGMGEVYGAWDRKLKRRVAIKFISQALLGSPDAERRLLHEAQAIARLNDPGIVRIYDIRNFESGLGIVMELLQGETLDARIQQRQLAIKEGLDILQQISSGLAFIHKNNILHRDLKPRNIMLINDDKRQLAKLLDFGLAQHLSTPAQPPTPEAEEKEQEPRFWGTPQFMSPEQVRNWNLDEKSDLFSLGIVFYYALTGELPFSHENPNQLLQKICTEKHPLISEKRPNIPIRVVNLIDQLLEKNPRERPENAAKVQEILQKACKESETIPDYRISPDLIDHYLNRLRAANRTFPVSGFKTKIDISVEIQEIYIHLKATVVRDQEDPQPHGKNDLSKSIALQDLFSEAARGDQRGAVIHGPPGSGKTTFLKYLVQKTTLGDGLEDLRLPMETLPVFLELRSMDQPDAGLKHALRHAISGDNMSLQENFVDYMIQQDHLLLMVDGLDEISDASVRHKTVAWLEKTLLELPKCFVIVTSRFPRGDRTTPFNRRFIKLELGALQKEEAQQFIRSWYRAVETDPRQEPALLTYREQAAKKAEDLCAKIFGSSDYPTEGLQELASNPLMLQCLCLVHRDRRTLPKRRSKLYDECIMGLLDLWRKHYKLPVDLESDDAIRILQPLAFYLQCQGLHRSHLQEILPALEEPLRALQLGFKNAEPIIAAIQDQSGILKTTEEGKLEFLHLVFQYHLAARHIRDKAGKDSTLLSLVAQNFNVDWWREVILLILSLNNPCLFEDLMRILVKQRSLSLNSSLVTACLKDAAEVTPRPALEELRHYQFSNLKGLPPVDETMEVLKFLDFTSDWQHEVVDGRTAQQILKAVAHEHSASRVRLKASELVGLKAPDVERNPTDNMLLVHIPAGTYTLGSEYQEDSQPMHRVELSPFLMGKYPVTNQQFRRYLKSNPEARHPRFWNDTNFRQDEQPVVGISWDEASAYCHWAGLQLPTEAQWEAAASSQKQFRFPWGNETPSEHQAHFSGRHHQTSNVRAYPAGEGPFGTWGQAGNVWEWCQDVWNPRAYDDRDGALNPREDTGDSTLRVIRGGSWKHQDWVLANTYRLWHGFGARESDIGFRCIKPLNDGTSLSQVSS